MKYLLFFAGVIFVLIGVLGVFLTGPIFEKNMQGFSISLNQSVSFFVLGNLSLGVYYLIRKKFLLRVSAILIAFATLAIIFGLPSIF